MGRLPWGVLLGLLCACAPKDVVVLELPKGPGTDAASPDDAGADGDASALNDSSATDDAPADARPAPPPGPPCQTNPDCAPNTYCMKNSCGDPVGGCGLRPIACANTESPVCGCDGVTYWNPCLAASDGVNLASSTNCSATEWAPCTDPTGASCPVSGASCARIIEGAGTCTPNFTGACWVLPDTCPNPPPPGPMYRSCAAPADCLDLCTAISTGVAHQKLPPPGTCP